MPNFNLNEKLLKEIVGKGEIEYSFYNKRSKSGTQTWEIKIINADNSRRIVVVRDYGFEINYKEIKINPFKTRAERNKEIYRLYYEEGLSQQFLTNLFGISQPSVSLIVNSKENRMKIKID